MKSDVWHAISLKKNNDVLDQDAINAEPEHFIHYNMTEV